LLIKVLELYAVTIPARHCFLTIWTSCILSVLSGKISDIDITEPVGSDFYRKLTGAELGPVKKSLVKIAKSGRHLEITTLIIPGHNDSEKEIASQAEWIAGELGKDTPLHLSRYFPMYKREDPPTRDETLERLVKIASDRLSYVYVGNISTKAGQNTKCPNCQKTVTRRNGYSIKLQNLDQQGNCSYCGTSIYKHFTYFSSSIKN